MKKFIACLCIIAMLFCCSCASDGGSSSASDSISASDGNSEDNGMLRVDEILNTYPESKLKCDKYSLGKYVTPYWTNQIIYNETVCFYEENGVIADKKLMYKPAKILEVRNYSLDVLYEEGKDYVMKDGDVVLFRFNV